jgi:hypothetical protein
LLAAERRGASGWPGIVVRAVVGRGQDNEIVCDAEAIEFREQQADEHVMLGHPVGVLVLAGRAAIPRYEFRFDRVLPPVTEDFQLSPALAVR